MGLVLALQLYFLSCMDDYIGHLILLLGGFSPSWFLACKSPVRTLALLREPSRSCWVRSNPAFPAGVDLPLQLYFPTMGRATHGAGANLTPAFTPVGSHVGAGLGLSQHFLRG